LTSNGAPANWAGPYIACFRIKARQHNIGNSFADHRRWQLRDIAFAAQSRHQGRCGKSGQHQKGHKRYQERCPERSA
jgi:hypothetical protein